MLLTVWFCCLFDFHRSRSAVCASPWINTVLQAKRSEPLELRNIKWILVEARFDTWKEMLDALASKCICNTFVDVVDEKQQSSSTRR
jgi:hypothetical protein